MATLVRCRPDPDDVLQSTIPSPFPAHLLRDLHDDVLDELATEPVDYDAPRNDIHTSVAAVQHSCLMTLASILSPISPLSIGAYANDSEHPSPSGAGIPLHQVLAETPLSCLVRALCSRDDHRDLHDQPPAEAALLSQLHELVDAIAPSLNRRDAHLAQAIVSLLLDLEQLSSSPLASAHLVPQSYPSLDTEDSSEPSSNSPYATIASLQRQLSSFQPSVASISGSRPTPAESVRTALLWARIDEQLDTVVSLCRAHTSSLPQHDIAQPPPSRLMAQSSEPQTWNNCRPSFDDALPPDYDSEYSYERPPSYAAGGHLRTSFEEKSTGQTRLADQYPPEKVSSRASTSVLPVDTEISTERNHSMSPNFNSLDLDTITHAIERLYIVAPQLANQRVELRREKIVQMEKAREGKGKARTLADTVDPELDKMLELLGRASAREIPDQSAVIDPYRTRREKGTVDIEEQRSRYLEYLVHRTRAGRLHTQDAVPSLSRSHSSPSCTGDSVQDMDDDHSTGVQSEETGTRNGKRASCPDALKSSSTREPKTEVNRNRSTSAPHRAWLKPKDKDGNVTSTKGGLDSLSWLPASSTSKSVRGLSGKLRGVSKSRPSSAGGESASHGALDIAYVAEHHETLKHVLLFIAYTSSSSLAPTRLPSAEVPPSTSGATYGDCLLLRLSGSPYIPLALPVPVVLGFKTVLSQGGHWEVKASCYESGAPPQESEDVPLLPASELSLLSPLSYTCSSCSLPLVPSPPTRYRDLPSEHWEELIDSWMCHPEGQTLAKIGFHGAYGNRNGSSFGFWPTRDEALVGRSYVLFDAEAVADGNIKCAGVREHLSRTLKKTIVVLPPTYAYSFLEALAGFGVRSVVLVDITRPTRDGITRLARCLCGATLGRQHDRRHEDNSVSRMYRLLKYAIRPISATSQVPKIPMSGFVLHDMVEHVQAHATYRFVLSDEEDERPRLLIWLFKPRIRISYMLPSSVVLPKSGTIDASKVLYKILGPASTTSNFRQILDKYPGFPQAEHLFYPMDVCRKLAMLLKESTASYPEGMRTMTDLDVGWLTMT